MRVNYRWDIDIDYNLNNSHCDCDSICRCGIITNIRVEEVAIISMVHTYVEAFNIITKVKELDKYCINRIFTNNKVWNADLWDIDICNGYYGEEISGAYLCNEREINNQIEKMLSLEDNKKIEYVLNLEYGYILEDLVGCNYMIDKVDKGFIKFGQREYVKKIKVEKYYSDDKYNYPRGIVIKDGENYRLIDGYHRVLSSNNDIIKMIVAIK